MIREIFTSNFDLFHFESSCICDCFCDASDPKKDDTNEDSRREIDI